MTRPPVSVYRPRRSYPARLRRKCALPRFQRGANFVFDSSFCESGSKVSLLTLFAPKMRVAGDTWHRLAISWFVRLSVLERGPLKFRRKRGLQFVGEIYPRRRRPLMPPPDTSDTGRKKNGCFHNLLTSFYIFGMWSVIFDRIQICKFIG